MNKAEEIAKLAPEICQLVERAIREERKAIGKSLRVVCRKQGGDFDYALRKLMETLERGERPEE